MEPTESRVSLVDTHCHLDDPRLWDRLAAVLANAREAQVGRIIAVGTDAESSRKLLAAADRTPGLHAAVGIHPNHVFEQSEGDFAAIVEMASQGIGARPVAIGETGLDRYWKKTPFEDQAVSFVKHLDLARELALPVVIHCRDSAEDILQTLAPRPRPIAGVLHSFTGDWDLAQRLLDLGLYLSFAGQITFTNKSLDPLRDAASRVPFDRLLVETDAPYLTPHPHRGEVNEPARVRVTAEKLASLRGLSLAELAAVTSANAAALFGLHDRPGL